MEYSRLPRYNFWIDTILRTFKLLLVVLTILFVISLPILLFQARMTYNWTFGYESAVETAIEERVAPLEARIEELEYQLDNQH